MEDESEFFDQYDDIRNLVNHAPCELQQAPGGRVPPPMASENGSEVERNQLDLF